MYTIVPFRRTVTRDMSVPFFNDNFFRSFFDVGDLFNSTGFRVDVREDDNGYQLQAELPGVARDKINLTVDEGVLTISADLNEEKTDRQTGYVYSERRAGHVERHFNLEGIDVDHITADHVNGVLMVNLPKEQPAPKKEAKKIEITSQGHLENGQT